MSLPHPMQPGVVALVVAAGRGSRSGFEKPKQYAMVGGRTVLERTLAALCKHPAVDAVQVVVGPGDEPSYRDAVNGLAKLLEPVIGGATRQESVRAGLEALAGLEPSTVLIHDAARPFVSDRLITAIIAAVDEGDAAIPGLPVTDTLKLDSNGRCAATVPRQDLVSVQTPQGFPFEAILQAHRAAADHPGLTDDEAVASLAGIPVRIVPGEAGNMKLTTPSDFAAAERLLAPAVETRTAQGFDVHAFGPGSSVWLCGVEIPHDKGLVGHSDADVGLHALTDALLGTIGDGDIGQHFPPSDPKWKGARSDQFLADAARRVRDRDGRILNLDVTLICEEPKIGPARERMRETLAAIAAVALNRVSVKATTSERLGFTGRREGIAALATASVELPREP